MPVPRDRDTDANGTFDERLYALQDANFNVTAITNTGGTVQEKYTETPFGATTFRNSSGTVIGSSAKDWVFLHQGGQADIIGDLDFRFRVLSPTLGRWLSNDPLGFQGGSANLYLYIGNNPENSLDPQGLNPFGIAPPGIVPLPGIAPGPGVPRLPGLLPGGAIAPIPVGGGGVMWGVIIRIPGYGIAAGIGYGIGDYIIRPVIGDPLGDLIVDIWCPPPKYLPGPKKCPDPILNPRPKTPPTPPWLDKICTDQLTADDSRCNDEAARLREWIGIFITDPRLQEWKRNCKEQASVRYRRCINQLPMRDFPPLPLPDEIPDFLR